MKQKKIIYLRTDLGARDLIAGGSVSHSIGVIKGFIELGYGVLCASSAMVQETQKLPLLGFLELKIPRYTRCLGHKMNALLSNITFTFYIIKLYRKHPIDFIYQRHSLLNCTGVLLRWWFKKPLVLEFNSSQIWSDDQALSKRKLKLRWLIRWLEKINIKKADRIIAISQAIKNDLIKLGVKPERIVLNPNGVDTQLFSASKLANKRQEIRASLGIQDRFVFGFIGTFSYWHGVDMLVHLIPRVVALHDHAYFLLIGSGVLHNQVRNGIEKIDIARNATTFIGMVPPEQARHYLAACDAFLLPTQPTEGNAFFGSPTKLFEYMSLGKPIIASRLDQLAEIIKPALTMEELKQATPEQIKDAVGILVRPDDVVGFVKAVCWLLEQDKNTSDIFGVNARDTVCKNYTWHHHVKKIIDHVPR